MGYYIRHMRIFVVLLFLPACCWSLMDGLYCGKENCYDVLGITRDSTKQEISRAYRTLAKKFHPDLHRGESAKKEAEDKFKVIATAYEILRESGSRADYDYMLDNPEEYYAHYYRYYRRRVAPKVDVRIVIVVTISIISIIQYYTGWTRYESAIRHFATVPKYRNKAMEMAQDEINSKVVKKGRNKLSKSEQKEEIEKIIRKVIEEQMDIKGAYAKPTVMDTLWIQLILLPYTLLKYVVWYCSWVWYFDVMKKPYGEVEKLYLIRRYMGLGQHQFDGIEDHKKAEFLKLELWKKPKYEEYKREEEEKLKIQLAENPRYKQYRRYMKNHGPGRLTFED